MRTRIPEGCLKSSRVNLRAAEHRRRHNLEELREKAEIQLSLWDGLNKVRTAQSSRRSPAQSRSTESLNIAPDNRLNVNPSSFCK